MQLNPAIARSQYNSRPFWTYKRYKLWFKTRPDSLKCILVVVLVFPLFAGLWDMKQLGVSPLQVLGMAVFCLASITALTRRARGNPLNFFFYFFFSLLLLNVMLVLAYEGTFHQFGHTVRTILPFVLILFFRKVITSRYDLEGFLLTFLLASIFPVITLYYEILFSPIREVYNTASRGGGLRLSGFYSDLFGYMSHLICGFICYGYFYIKQPKNYKSIIFGPLGFTLVTAIFFIGVFNLRHQSSWAVSIILVFMFLYFVRKRINFTQQAFLLACFLGVVIYFYMNIFEVLYAKDIRVFSGDARESAALNGRVWIWQRYFAYWEGFSLFSVLFGSGFEFHPVVKIMISGGMHNDFIRLLFTTGVVGILAYIFYLMSICFSSIFIASPELRYVTLSTLVVVMMYGISALPLLSSGAMLYFIAAMFSQVNIK